MENKLGKFIVIESDSPTIRDRVINHLMKNIKSCDVAFVKTSETLEAVDEMAAGLRILYLDDTMWRELVLIREAVLLGAIERSIKTRIIDGKNVISDSFDYLVFSGNLTDLNRDEINFFKSINDKVISLCNPTLRIFIKTGELNPDIAPEFQIPEWSERVFVKYSECLPLGSKFEKLIYTGDDNWVLTTVNDLISEHLLFE